MGQIFYRSRPEKNSSNQLLSNFVPNFFNFVKLISQGFREKFKGIDQGHHINN